jgi:hypothetical protein
MLPEVCKEKLVIFQKYGLKLRKLHEYFLGKIQNGDQTLVLFDMLESTTVNSAGKNRTMGAKKRCYIIVLAITADRQKLPPFVVFHCNTMAEEKFLQGVTVLVQEVAG